MRKVRICTMQLLRSGWYSSGIAPGIAWYTIGNCLVHRCSSYYEQKSCFSLNTKRFCILHLALLFLWFIINTQEYHDIHNPYILATRFNCNFGCNQSNWMFLMSNSRWDIQDSNYARNIEKDWNHANLHSNWIDIYFVDKE